MLSSFFLSGEYYVPKLNSTTRLFSSKIVFRRMIAFLLSFFIPTIVGIASPPRCPTTTIATIRYFLFFQWKTIVNKNSKKKWWRVHKQCIHLKFPCSLWLHVELARDSAFLSFAFCCSTDSSERLLLLLLICHSYQQDWVSPNNRS